MTINPGTLFRVLEPCGSRRVWADGGVDFLGAPVPLSAGDTLILLDPLDDEDDYATVRTPKGMIVAVRRVYLEQLDPGTPVKGTCAVVVEQTPHGTQCILADGHIGKLHYVAGDPSVGVRDLEEVMADLLLARGWRVREISYLLRTGISESGLVTLRGLRTYYGV